MSFFKTFIAFAIGAAGGSVLTYFLVKEKYMSIAEEEIRAVREVYHKAANDSEDKPATSSSEETTSNSKNNYEHSSLDAERHAKAQQNINKPIPPDYTTYYKSDEDVEIKEPEEMEKIIEYKPPYVISPDEFGQIPSYTEMYLVLHPNGSITDSESGEEVEDIDDLIGNKWAGQIGEYELNIVRVRNDRLSMDIEIEQILPNVVPQENPMIFTSASISKGEIKGKPTRKPHEVGE